MKLKDKSVLVVGLGISGISTVKMLHRLGAKISIIDSKSKAELSNVLNTYLKGIPLNMYLGIDDMDLSNIDVIIKSPGVPPSTKVIKEAMKKDIEIITDIELGFRLSATENIIAITGSNGKTTTTHLVGETFKKAKHNTFIVGNIGVGILEKINDVKQDDVIIIEASSFQLENIIDFKPRVSLILNISPDHIDWHGSYESYIKAKKKIFRNQNKDDYTILNYDDQVIRDFAGEVKSNIIWFSVNNPLDSGIYIKDDKIIINLDNRKTELMSCRDLKLIGKHNLENILASIGIFHAMRLSNDVIREVLENFKGVEHRLEYVTEINKRKFYNDSKGTNPEASIKAIEAMDGPIVLIAGGYNKAAEFDEFVKSFKSKVKNLILLGSTSEQIGATAIKYGFTNNHFVKDMNEAVKLAYRLSEERQNILLSPACASWDMYKDFEERGSCFKREVYDLGEGYNGTKK